jgi:hypothetical protein
MEAKNCWSREAKPGENRPVNRILVGMYDYYSGLDTSSFRVTADFMVADEAPGNELAEKFTETSPGVWELALARPLDRLPSGTLHVSVKDQQGNETRIVRRFSVAK